jgi:hypothetical protein
MTVVWILLALFGLIAGVNSLSVAFGAGGAGVVAGQRRTPYAGLVLAAAALAGMVVVAYTQDRTWMVVVSWIVLGLVLLYGLLTRLMAPPIERIQPDDFLDRVQDYAEGPGPHSTSFAVQGSLLATMRGDLHSAKLPRSRLTRHALTDGSCLYCLIEQSLQVLFLDEDNRGDEVVREYRTHLRTGPNVEVHMRRPDAGHPWHLEFAVPKQQPPWKSEFGRMACATHRPANLG